MFSCKANFCNQDGFKAKFKRKTDYGIYKFTFRCISLAFWAHLKYPNTVYIDGQEKLGTFHVTFVY